MSKIVKKIVKKELISKILAKILRVENNNKKPIIAITGSIASGKDFISNIFAKNGFAVFDADFEVRNIITNNLQVIKEIAQYFPDAVNDGKINRLKLGNIIFSGSPLVVQQKSQKLEQIIYPELQKSYQIFLEKNQSQPIVLNIPLFFEKGNFTADIAISTIASKYLRKKRFISREINKIKQSIDQENQQGCNKLNKLVNSKQIKAIEHKFLTINRTQINNIARKKLYFDGKIDFLINTNLSKAAVTKQLYRIIKLLKYRLL